MPAAHWAAAGFIAPTGADGINVSGVLAPGGSVNTTGNLTLNLGGTTGTVTMNGGSGFEFLLGSAGLSITSVGTSDLLTIAGAAANDFVLQRQRRGFPQLRSDRLLQALRHQQRRTPTPGPGSSYDSVTGVVEFRPHLQQSGGRSDREPSLSALPAMVVTSETSTSKSSLNPGAALLGGLGTASVAAPPPRGMSARPRFHRFQPFIKAADPPFGGLFHGLGLWR